MSRLFAIALAVCLLVSCASATTFCIGLAPSFAPGASCGHGAASCVQGYYCDSTATCVPQLAAGKKCDTSYSDECAIGTKCQGTSTNAVCVQYASLGETCQTDPTVTKPMCWNNGWTCDSTTNKCVGGRTGDVCKTDADCGNSNFNCTGGVCGAAGLGDFCNNTITCGPKLFCDVSISPVACSLRKTGGLCSNVNQCAFGYTCSGYFEGDSTTQCIPVRSVAAGKWCGGNHDVCQSGRCSYDGYCASGIPQYCIEDYDCGVDQTCTCNGQFWVDGDFGTCSYDPCYPAWQNLLKCYNDNCGFIPDIPLASFHSIETECVGHSCKDVYDAYSQCAGASQLAVSLVFATLLALFAFVSSKEF